MERVQPSAPPPKYDDLYERDKLPSYSEVMKSETYRKQNKENRDREVATRLSKRELKSKRRKVKFVKG